MEIRLLVGDLEYRKNHRNYVRTHRKTYPGEGLAQHELQSLFRRDVSKIIKNDCNDQMADLKTNTRSG